MADTITAYYTFKSKTPAKSSEMNNNFGLYRGGFLPYDEDTATASNNTWDLGMTEHRWAGHYSPTLRSDLDSGFQMLNVGSTIAAYSANHRYYSARTGAQYPTSGSSDLGFGWPWSGVYGWGTQQDQNSNSAYVVFRCTTTTYDKPIMFKIHQTYKAYELAQKQTISIAKGLNQSPFTVLTWSSVSSFVFQTYTIGASYQNGGTNSPGQGRMAYTQTLYFYDFNPGATTEVYTLINHLEKAAPGGGGRRTLSTLDTNVRIEQIF